MQQLHHLGCAWTDNGQMYLNQGNDILFSFIDAFTNITNLRTVSNVQIPVHSLATIPTKINGKCIAVIPYILEVDINETISIQNPQLIMLPMAHLQDEIEPQESNADSYKFIT